MKSSALYSGLLSLLLIVWGYSALAQVPVKNEPRHKVVLENEYVRLIDVHIPPGDTTLYHVHALPSVVVVITKALTGSQVMGENPTSPGESQPGNTWFAAYNEKPITHRVFNAGDTMFHVMDIELVKEKIDTGICKIEKQNGGELLWEEKTVRCYKLIITHGGQYKLP